MRHKDDNVLAKCLDDLRSGKITKTLLSRCFHWNGGGKIYASGNNVEKEEKEGEKLPSVEKAIYLFPTRRAADHHNAACLAKIQGETRIFEPKKVVLGANGDWCEPVSVLAHLENTFSSTTAFDDINKKTTNSSPATAFFKLPKNVEKIRRRLRNALIENNVPITNESSSLMMMKRTTPNKISIRPGNRISISAATAVQERLKQKIMLMV